MTTSVSSSIRTVLSASSRPISVSCAASTSRRRAAAIRGWSRAASMRGSRPRMIAASGASDDWPASGARIRRLRSSASMSASNIAAASCSARYSRASGVVERRSTVSVKVARSMTLRLAQAEVLAAATAGMRASTSSAARRDRNTGAVYGAPAKRRVGRRPVNSSVRRRRATSREWSYEAADVVGPRPTHGREDAPGRRLLRPRIAVRRPTGPAGPCRRRGTTVFGGFRHDTCRKPLPCVRLMRT